jgi:hypothetical protein
LCRVPERRYQPFQLRLQHALVHNLAFEGHAADDLSGDAGDVDSALFLCWELALMGVFRWRMADADRYTNPGGSQIEPVAVVVRIFSIW